MRIRPAMVIAMALAVAAVAQPAAGQHAASLPCAFEAGPTRAVASVIDGDTVRLDDGVQVRLLGVLAPRASDAGADAASWPPALAAEAALRELVGGKSLSLAFAGAHADRYDRVLAHLFIGEGDQQIWVQAKMVELGHARVAALPGSDTCIRQLLARERHAREAGTGLWAHAAYQIRPADRPSELGRYRFTFQLVRGRVERARQSRGLAILELANGERPAADEGRSQWGAFRVIWRPRIADKTGLDRAMTFKGRNVLVRGWIGAHFGPEIEILTAGQLEFED